MSDAGLYFGLIRELVRIFGQTHDRNQAWASKVVKTADENGSADGGYDICIRIYPPGFAAIPDEPLQESHNG